jgi:hypothetical protein
MTTSKTTTHVIGLASAAIMRAAISVSVEKAGSLKYEFRVKPKARIGDIRLAYRGADKLDSIAGPTCPIETTMITLRDAAPVSYQDVGGTRTAVQNRYLLDGDSHWCSVGAGYQADRDLIIEPGVEYSTSSAARAMRSPPGSSPRSGRAHVQAAPSRQATCFFTLNGPANVQ